MEDVRSKVGRGIGFNLWVALNFGVLEEYLDPELGQRKA